MNRRDLFRLSTAAAVSAALPVTSLAQENPQFTPLQPPATGPIRVAFFFVA